MFIRPAAAVGPCSWNSGPCQLVDRRDFDCGTLMSSQEGATFPLAWVECRRSLNYFHGPLWQIVEFRLEVEVVDWVVKGGT
jgi:hypothetical protein